MNQLPTITPENLSFPILPGAWPSVGHYPQAAWDTPKVLREAQALGPLVWINLSGWGLIVCHPDGFELLKGKTLSIAPMVRNSGDLVADSVLSVDGAEHRRMRGSMNRPFTPEGLSGEGAAKRMAELVEARSKGMAESTRFNALNELRDLALDIIFGVLGVPDADLPWWREKYQRTLLTSFPIAKSVPFSPAWFARRASAEIGQRLQEEAARAQAEGSPGLLAALAHGRDEHGKGLNAQELVANVRILGLAGHETTASILTWSLAYLSLDDALWDRLVVEANAAGHIPQAPADLKKHPIAEAIFRESLRLNTPLPVMMRELVAPAEVAGVTLPVGTAVRLPLWLWNRDPDRYPEPERYNPDRWLGRDRKPDPVEMSPFGGGAHFCLGYHLAILEGVQLLTAMAQRAQGRRLRLVKGALPTERFFPLIQPQGKDTEMVWERA